MSDSGQSLDGMERIKYGNETLTRLSDGTPLYLPRHTGLCHDCGVERGELHREGCDAEQCPECGMQLIGCDHANRYLASDTDRSKGGEGR